MAGELSHLIQYRCVASAHQRLNQQECVFVRDGGWAYCPAGRTQPEHQFIAIGGLDRRRLKAGVRLAIEAKANKGA